jgi:hypothetical protein
MGSYGSSTYGSGPYSGVEQEAEFRKFASGPVLLVEIESPSGARYVSSFHVKFVDRHYMGRLISIGPIARVIQRNLGIYETTAVQIEVADTDFLYSTIAEPIKGVTVRVKIGTTLMPLTDYQTILIGKIDDWTIDNFRVSFVVKDSTVTFPEFPATGFVSETDFPNAYNQVRGQPLPVCYGEHSVTASEDNRDRGAWPTLYVDNTSGAKKFLIARHAVKSILGVYVNKPSSGSALLTEGANYTAVPAGVLLGQRMAWIQFTDAQFTSSVVDTGGVVGDVRVNVQGAETVGDGSGTLITNPIDVLEHFMGRYVGNPSVDATSFNVARSVCLSRGYTVRGGYVGKKSTANALSEFARSFNLLLFIDKLGNLAVNLFDPSSYPPGSSSSLFDEARDIYRGSWSIDRQAQIEGAEDAQIVNSVDFSHSYHWAVDKFFGHDKLTDAPSIATYGEKTLVLEMPWLASSTAASDVSQRIVFQFKAPVPHANFKTSLRGLLTELAEQMTLNHVNGHDGTPWSSRRAQVMQLGFNPADYSTTLRARDVQPIVEGAYFFDDESIRTRVSNGTVAVTNGSAQINATAATSFITAGVQVGDIIRLKTATNTGNVKNLKITAVIDLDTVETAQTVWTNESGIIYEIVPSWLTASDAQKEYGHLADESTEQFSNGDAGFSLL